MNKTYSRINWENYPSEKTPLNEVYLNRIDYSVNEIDNRVISLDTAKLDKTTANGLVKGVAYNNANGVFTVTYLNGSTAAIDTKMEKLAVNFSYDAADQRLVITLDDGTKQYVDLTSLITEYEFSNSNTISFTVENGKVKANVNRGAITGDMLQPDYLADITVQAKKAEKGAADSALSAEESETAARRAEKAAEDAESIAGVGIATTEKAGIIKGNADEFLVAGDGKLSLTSSYAVQNTLTEITGTENKKTLFGKIAKGVKELISHIGNGSIHNVLTNNLLATVAGTALDAVQGKALDDKITEVNRKLSPVELWNGVTNAGDSPVLLKDNITLYKTFTFTCAGGAYYSVGTFKSSYGLNNHYTIPVGKGYITVISAASNYLSLEENTSGLALRRIHAWKY